MITIVDGDLLQSDCDVIMHQVNCQNVMGSGIARQIRSKYPKLYTEFISDTRNQFSKLGKFTAYHEFNDIYIYNLFGQLKYGKYKKQYTDYKALRSALDSAVKDVTSIEEEINKTLKIGLPFGIGAGLGGGNWLTIYNIIEDISNSHNIYLYRLDI